MNYDKLIDLIFFKDNFYNKSASNRYNLRKYKKYPNIINYLKYRYNDSESDRETIYRIHYNIENTPLCPICGKKLKFYGRNNKIFLSHCSNKCKKLDSEVNTKWKESCGELGTNREKAKQTMINKYGVDNPYKIPKIIEKIKNINKSKIKESLKKQEETNIKKYGYKSYLQTEEFKIKSKNTSLFKYGVDHPMKSNEIKSKLDYNNIVKKIIQTKEKNHTFNTSKDEDESYILLKEKFNNVIRQYKEARYPYLCDFYIPEIDLFIECQYGWQHGKHPYDNNNNEDIDKVNLIKNKKTKYYQNVLYNWTIRDVKKRNIAKENKLNYLEFWNINELKEWLLKY